MTMIGRILACLLILLLPSACKKSLRGELSETQAEEVGALLQREGIDSRKERDESGTWSIMVDDAARADAERVAHLYGAPRPAHATIAEIFSGKGLLPSQLEEHARYEFALGQELASTLEAIDGVLAARVHVAMPIPNPRNRERQPPTASVFVRYRSDQRVDMMKSQIKQLVAQALPDADAESVAVMSVPVYPLADVARRTRTLLGLRYRTDDAVRLSLLLVFPWVLVAALSVYLAHRAGLFRSLMAWMTSARKSMAGGSGRRARRRGA